MGEGQYENVLTNRAISQIDLPFFREVQSIQAEAQPQEKGDILDALIVSLDMLCRFCGTKKYRKRIFLITNGENSTNVENSTEYAENTRRIRGGRSLSDC